MISYNNKNVYVYVQQRGTKSTSIQVKKVVDMTGSKRTLNTNRSLKISVSSLITIQFDFISFIQNFLLRINRSLNVLLEKKKFNVTFMVISVCLSCFPDFYDIIYDIIYLFIFAIKLV